MGKLSGRHRKVPQALKTKVGIRGSRSRCSKPGAARVANPGADQLYETNGARPLYEKGSTRSRASEKIKKQIDYDAAFNEAVEGGRKTQIQRQSARTFQSQTGENVATESESGREPTVLGLQSGMIGSIKPITERSSKDESKAVGSTDTGLFADMGKSTLRAGAGSLTIQTRAQRNASSSLNQ